MDVAEASQAKENADRGAGEKVGVTQSLRDSKGKAKFNSYKDDLGKGM